MGQTYQAVFIRQLCFICGFYCQINNLSGELVKLYSGAREGGGGEWVLHSHWGFCHKSGSLETTELVWNQDESLQNPPILPESSKLHRTIPSNQTQCRTGIGTESKFRHLSLCLSHSYSLVGFISLLFCETSSFRNGPRENIKRRHHCGYLNAVLEGNVFVPWHVPGLLWRKYTANKATHVSVLLGCISHGYDQSHSCQ